MNTKKIVTVLGARPQFVKAAVLSRIISQRKEFNEIIVHTGQHYDQNMSQVFFEEMDIPDPKYNLGIQGKGHGGMTGEMLGKLEEVINVEQPDLVLVYGDTNSTLAGALAAKKMNIPLLHIEAGLRSFNSQMPEETNRIVTDRISDLLFCPTQAAIDNLKLEGFDHFESRVVLTGDIMSDSVSYYRSISAERSHIVDSLGLEPTNFVLATIHRQENTDHREVLAGIIAGLNEIVQETNVLMPLHPRTKKMLEKFNLSFEGQAIAPVGYFDMLQLLAHCSMVVTDSGGLQKEAYFNRKPCLIARKETEWIELVEGGYAVITGADQKLLKETFHHFKNHCPDYSRHLYGKNVGQIMYKEIHKFFNKK